MDVSETLEIRVHIFASTAEAYDASQTNAEIRSGDVLAVPSEGVVGVLDEAWPVAVVFGVAGPGAFHTLDVANGFAWETVRGGSMVASVAKAKAWWEENKAGAAAVSTVRAAACDWCGDKATRENAFSGEFACAECPERNLRRDFACVGEGTFEEFKAAVLESWRAL